MHLAAAPVEAVEVVDDVWKFDFPFLADKNAESTVEAFGTATLNWTSPTSTQGLPS